jgi:hypothetical protein
MRIVQMIPPPMRAADMVALPSPALLRVEGVWKVCRISIN